MHSFLVGAQFYGFERRQVNRFNMRTSLRFSRHESRLDKTSIHRTLNISRGGFFFASSARSMGMPSMPAAMPAEVTEQLAGHALYSRVVHVRNDHTRRPDRFGAKSRNTTRRNRRTAKLSALDQSRRFNGTLKSKGSKVRTPQIRKLRDSDSCFFALRHFESARRTARCARHGSAPRQSDGKFVALFRRIADSILCITMIQSPPSTLY